MCSQVGSTVVQRNLFWRSVLETANMMLDWPIPILASVFEISTILDSIHDGYRALPLGNTSSGKVSRSWGWSVGAIHPRMPSFNRMFLV